MNKFILHFITVTIFMMGTSFKAFAHGEDKPGPHGGIIRMPGAFHTEVLPVSVNTFRVYLLDIRFESPMTRDSWVKMSLINNGTKIETDCKKSNDSFLCEFPPNSNLITGSLEVIAKRADFQGITVNYELPLKEKKS